MCHLRYVRACMCTTDHFLSSIDRRRACPQEVASERDSPPTLRATLPRRVTQPPTLLYHKYHDFVPRRLVCLQNTGRWTYDEHRLFLRGLELHGKGWKKIASLIKTRTVVQIRTHAQKYFQKIAKAKQNGDHGEVAMDSKGNGSRRKSRG